MPAPTKGARLGKSPSHERKILMNLAKNILDQNHVTTTLTKAKRVRPLVEKLITLGKKGDLHARRLALKVITDKGTIEKLFTEIAELFKDRQGGYTRITKIGVRKGDNAPLAVIELVGGLSLSDSRPGKPVATPEDEKESETDPSKQSEDETEDSKTKEESKEESSKEDNKAEESKDDSEDVIDAK